MVRQGNEAETITIGELSKLTGVTTHTIRIWEKRYGAPEAIRLPSGHRRYRRDEVNRLRAIAKALESGYRASKVVTGTLRELHELLGLAKPEEKQSSILPERSITDWLEYVKAFDNETLLNDFHKIWSAVGPKDFVSNYASSFIKHIETGWQVGDISVAQEHFASEHISSFLTGKWRQLSQYNQGPTAIMTTLPGDGCQLGLIMCAAITSIHNYKVVFLGPNTPCLDITSSLKACNSNLLCVSITTCLDPLVAENYLLKIRADVDDEVVIVTGGGGSPDIIPGVDNFKNFNKYHDWLCEIKNKKLN
tara:strand:+ start:1399 stop:2316 length:918 start_codon:yes stop_codon:yes gene_type:complete